MGSEMCIRDRVIGDQNVHIMHKKDEHTYGNGDVLDLSVLDI